MGKRVIVCDICRGKWFDCPACGGNAFDEALGVVTVGPDEDGDRSAQKPSEDRRVATAEEAPEEELCP